MNKDKALVKKKDNIFRSILNKIKSFFNKKTNENLELNVAEERNITNSLDSFKLYNGDYSKLVKLQKELENDEISIADISDEIAEQLIELYKKQMPDIII